MARYVVTWVALVTLAAASLGFSFLPLGAAGIGVALAIAAIKAGLVGAMFMHLGDAETSVHVAIGAAIGLTLLLGGFVVADVLG